MKIGILYICTGEYSVFWKEFYESYEKFFLPNDEKEYFVFTDSEHIEYEEKENVNKIYQQQLGWPYDTMMRFSIFLNHEDMYENCQYLFFMNANCECKSEITADEFLPKNCKLTVVRHPGFYNKGNNDYPYDRNKNCTAYIPTGEGKYYVCGGVNGGETKAYLTLIKTLDKMTNEDIDNKIIPLWHDESIINKYVYLHEKEFEILDPCFCFPEGWKIPFDEKIIVRDKSRYINVTKIKGKYLQWIKDSIYLIIKTLRKK